MQAGFLVRNDNYFVSHDYNRSMDPGDAHDLDRNNMTISTSTDMGGTWSHLPIMASDNSVIPPPAFYRPTSV